MITSTTTTALSNLGTQINNGLDAILPAIVATISPFWVQLVVVGVILGVVGGVVAMLTPKGKFRVGRKIKI